MGTMVVEGEENDEEFHEGLVVGMVVEEDGKKEGIIGRFECAKIDKS